MTGLRWASRVRRKPGTLLRAKRRVILKECSKVAGLLRDQLASTVPGKVETSYTVRNLRSTLRQLRAQVRRDSTGSRSKLVAAALNDLDRSLAKFEQATRTADPGLAAEILADGKRALDQARDKAKAAGHDWQL